MFLDRIHPAPVVLALGVVTSAFVSNTNRDGPASAIIEAPAPSPKDVIVSTDWLAAHIAEPDLVVVHVSRKGDSEAERIPGSRELSYVDIIGSSGGNRRDLPDATTLKNLFRNLGVSADTRIVLYGDATMTARAFYTLDFLGLKRVSVLDGGLCKWKREKRQVTRRVAPAKPRPVEVYGRPTVIA